MSDFGKILRIAENFLTQAQLLGGTSSMTRVGIQAKMRQYKSIVEPVASKSYFYERWFGNPPGVDALEVIDKILSGGAPDEESKAAAERDIRTNFPNINPVEFMKQVNGYVPIKNMYD